MAGWAGLDRIGLAFRDAAAPLSGALELIDGRGALVGLSGSSMDTEAGSAEWSLDAPLANGAHAARLDLDGDGTVELEWDFLVLEGDVNGGGLLTGADLALVEGALGGGGARMDLNRNGVVDEDDMARMNAILNTKE